MSVYSSITAMIRRYGDDITISESGNTRSSKAIIQPLMYKNKMYLGGSALPSGYFDAGHFLMIASIDEVITDYSQTLITDNGVTYTIKRSEVVRADNTDLYIWAVLTPYSPEAEDDYEETD